MSRRKLIDWTILSRRTVSVSPLLVLAAGAVLGWVGSSSTRVAAQSAGGPGYQTYTTNFPLTENPISENGGWINGGTVGLLWNNIQTVGGMAQGVGPASVLYSDPTAILAGTWGPNQTVTATVYSNGVEEEPQQTFDKEVEIRLRATVTADSITGYEINCRTPDDSYGYMQIVRWNGPLGSFTQLDGANTGCGNGDIMRATIFGSKISVYKNGQLIMSWSDGTYTSGSPGIGFNYGCGTYYDEFGFTNFTATDHSASGASGPAPPTNLSGTSGN